MCWLFLQNFWHICSQQSLLYHIFFSLLFDHYVIYTHTLFFAWNSNVDIKTFFPGSWHFLTGFPPIHTAATRWTFSLVKSDKMCSIDPPKQKCNTRRLKIKRRHLVAHVGCDRWHHLCPQAVVSIAWHLEHSKYSCSTLHLQWSVAVDFSSVPVSFLFSPQLQSCSHSASGTSAQEITVTPLLLSIKCLAPSNSLGFSLCTVRFVSLPCSRFFSQEVPVCSESHPA